MSDQIKIKIPSFEYFSIACDESTDIGGTAQLAVFFRACDMEFNVFEELLEVISIMSDTTTGEDVFVSVFELLNKYDLPLAKLSSMATDGAPSMTGKNKGFVERLQKKKMLNIHFIRNIVLYIYQEVLRSKVINMAHIIRPVKQIVNFIRSRGLNQRQFSIFLDNLES